MTELEKCQKGLWYDTGFPGREESHIVCADLCYEYNHTRPSDMQRREELIRKIFGKVGKNPYVEPNIFCGFGWNIEVGDHFFANNSCVFVDPGKITFGDYVFIAPQCGFYTAGHPLDTEQRNAGLEIAKPIRVGSHVWFGGGVKVLPGVTIGSNVVIGAGSVVTKDIPDGVLAYGNPCRVIRPLTEADRVEYSV
jgi:acetyltransferase-like isoleucine patch superfamily enzyme